MENQLYTVKQVAEMWSVSVRHIYLLIRTGEIESVSLGNKIKRITRSEVERYIRVNTRTKAPAKGRLRSTGRTKISDCEYTGISADLLKRKN